MNGLGWSDDINKAILTLPQKDNINFYIPVSEKIRKMCWNQGDWRFYWYYRKGNKKLIILVDKERLWMLQLAQRLNCQILKRAVLTLRWNLIDGIIGRL